MDNIEITIKTFQQYIKRGDIKKPTWFALEHNIILHPDFFGITGDEFRAFIWILGVAAHINSPTIRVYPNVCASQINIPAEVVQSCIEKLRGKRWDVTAPSRKRTGNSKAACPTQQNSTRQNITVHDTTELSAAGAADASVRKDDGLDLRRLSWDRYQAAYLERYKKEPIRNKDVNGQIKRLVARLGEDTPAVLEFYVGHNDRAFVQNCHPVLMCLNKAEGLHTQWVRGRAITGADMKQFENQQHFTEQLNRIDAGEL